MALVIQKYKISGKNYLKHLHRSLEKLRDDENCALIGLCRKLKSFSDPNHDSSVFEIDFKNRESSIGIILKRAEELLREVSDTNHNFKMEYVIASMTSEDFVALAEECLRTGNTVSIVGRFVKTFNEEFDNPPAKAK